MKPKNSIETNKSDGEAKAEQTSTHSKDKVPDQLINSQMVQNVLLIWLDNNIDDNSTDCHNTITQLRRTVNTINTFTDGDQCIKFIDSMGNEKVCMIISGSLGQQIVPRVHNMTQVDSVFIFCANKERHQQWTKEWPKVKGVFTEIAPICEALKQTARQCEQNAISMSFMATSGDTFKKNLDQLDCSFMYTQILKEILLTINFGEKHFTEFIEYCCDVFNDNEGELQNVHKLQRKYRAQSPIWWYTYECFLYPMLNRALTLMDVDTIIKLGFFIDDLHRHIEKLYAEQFGGQQTSERFTVYRGQGMSKSEFEQMNKAKGGLIAFNNFLSTSKNRNVSLDFASSAVMNPDLMGIFFVMTINSARSTTPFASIVDVSYFKDKEDEVLFAMHTVFCINDIKPMDEHHRLFLVELTLTSDNDEDLRQLTNRIREETQGLTGWDQLGELLLRMGQSKKAQQVYEILLGQTTQESEKARIYHQLGRAKDDLGEYEEAIIFSKKALQIRQQSFPSNQLELAASYNNIGNVYDSMGEYAKALSYFEQALEIRQQSLPLNYPDLAKSYGNIGNMYDSMGEYAEALSYYKQALKIRQQSLPTNHPDLAKSYNNIGSVYNSMDEYSKALSSYKKALDIQQQSLPPSYPDLASCYNNIGLVYENMDNDSKAQSFYEHAVEIGQQSLPSNHPRLQNWTRNLGRVKQNCNQSACFLSKRKIK